MSIPAINIAVNASEKIKEIVRHEFIKHFFFFRKKKTCAKRKTKEIFLVKVFIEDKKVV